MYFVRREKSGKITAFGKDRIDMSETIETVFSVSDFFRFHYLELGTGHIKPDFLCDGWELIYVDKGSISVCEDGQKRQIESGHTFIRKPGKGSTLQASDTAAVNLYCISFGLQKGDLCQFEGMIVPASPELRAYIKIILKEAKFTYRNDLRNPGYPELVKNEDCPFGAEQMMKTLLEQFLICLARQATVRPGRGYAELVRENLIMNNLGSNPYFDHLVRYLEQKIDQQLTIEQICRDNFTNRSKIQKVFKECTTEGIVSFHQKLKIEYAKLMIRETPMNFTEISEKLGFSSVHHFSKKFKQLVRMSPSEYQRFAK